MVRWSRCLSPPSLCSVPAEFCQTPSHATKTRHLNTAKFRIEISWFNSLFSHEWGKCLLTVQYLTMHYKHVVKIFNLLPFPHPYQHYFHCKCIISHDHCVSVNFLGICIWYLLVDEDTLNGTHLFIQLHHAGVIRIQNVSLFVADNQVQSQHPTNTGKHCTHTAYILLKHCTYFVHTENILWM